MSSCWPLPPTVYSAPPPPPYAEGFQMPVWGIVLLLLGSMAVTAGLVLGMVVCQGRIKERREAEQKRILTEAVEGELGPASNAAQ